jgi:hypothetical protein
MGTFPPRGAATVSRTARLGGCFDCNGAHDAKFSRRSGH